VFPALVLFFLSYHGHSPTSPQEFSIEALWLRDRDRRWDLLPPIVPRFSSLYTLHPTVQGECGPSRRSAAGWAGRSLFFFSFSFRFLSWVQLFIGHPRSRFHWLTRRCPDDPPPTFVSLSTATGFQFCAVLLSQRSREREGLCKSGPRSTSLGPSFSFVPIFFFF